jgi:hypothetical protein
MVCWCFGTYPDMILKMRAVRCNEYLKLELLGGWGAPERTGSPCVDP